MNKESEGFECLGKKICKQKRGQGKTKSFSSVLKENSFLENSTAKLIECCWQQNLGRVWKRVQ